MNFSKYDEPARFTQPVRQITYMLVILGFVAIGSFLAFGQIKSFFLANPYLNGVIAGVFLVGLLACFWQISQIITSVIWIDAFIEDRPNFDMVKPPRLLAPIAGMLRYGGARQLISPTSSRSMLDSVVSRMDESRDISRYLSNLLIFLGLLGTFYGLAITVPAVVETIRSLAPEESEGGVAVFSRLMDGLEKQLGGMGTAFSSSLLGLAGSLVVGLLDLFAGHGQNGFYRELEDWLSRNTSVGLVGPDAQSGRVEETDMSASVLAAEFAGFRELLIRSSEENSRIASSLEELANSVEGLVEKMDARIAEERSSAEAMEKGRRPDRAACGGAGDGRGLAFEVGGGPDRCGIKDASQADRNSAIANVRRQFAGEKRTSAAESALNSTSWRKRFENNRAIALRAPPSGWKWIAPELRETA